jgi:hypothetical protein
MVKKACSTFVAFLAEVSKKGIPNWSAKSCLFPMDELTGSFEFQKAMECECAKRMMALGGQDIGLFEPTVGFSFLQ